MVLSTVPERTLEVSHKGQRLDLAFPEDVPQDIVIRRLRLVLH